MVIGDAWHAKTHLRWYGTLLIDETEYIRIELWLNRTSVIAVGMTGTLYWTNLDRPQEIGLGNLLTNRHQSLQGSSVGTTKRKVDEKER